MYFKFEAQEYIVLDCGALPDIANGIIDQSSGTGLSAVTTYTCDPGFTLLGDSTRECGSDEVWTNSEPSCAGKGNGQNCSKQFGSGTAILCSDNNHTHFCIFTSSSSPYNYVVWPWPYLPYRLLRA